jgi:rod shape-determining protein MreC
MHYAGFQKIFDEIKFFTTSAMVTLNRMCESVYSGASNLLYFISHDVDKTIMELHKENLRLSHEIKNLNHLKTENEELRKFLSMKAMPEYSVVVAKIISVFSNDYARSCVLDVGTNEGISVDDMVQNHDGLVGRISEVHDTWCRALLITDTNSNLPVKIGNDQINAIASGDNSNILHISMTHEDLSVKDGDIVVTSGFGNVFCDNVPVGTVVEKKGEFSIVPFVNFNSLKYASILNKK